jgi:hypothetical protein
MKLWMKEAIAEAKALAEKNPDPKAQLKPDQHQTPDKEETSTEPGAVSC